MNTHSSGYYSIDKDYNILSYNDTAKQLYPNLQPGVKCYKALMGLDSPCPPCPVALGIQGPKTYLDPIRHIYETVDAVETVQPDGSRGHALVFSTVAEGESLSKSIPTGENSLRLLGAINLLASDYMSVYGVNRETGKISVYRSRFTDAFADIKDNADYKLSFNFLIQKYIHPDERSYVSRHLNYETLLERLSQEASFKFHFRVVTDTVHYYYLLIARNGNADDYRDFVIAVACEDNDVTARKIYENQLHSLLASITHAAGYFHLDLTDDKILKIGGTSALAYKIDADASIDHFIAETAVFIPVLKDRNDFINAFCRSSLMKSYEDGQVEVTRVSRCLYDDNITRLSKYVTRLLLNPSNNHLEAILYGEDVTRTQEAYETQVSIVQTLSSNYLNVYLINPREKTLSVIKQEDRDVPAPDKKHNNTYPYDLFLSDYIRQRVYPDDRTMLEESLELDNVMSVLSGQSEYKGNYRINDRDGIHYYQFRFIKNEDSGIIVLGFLNVDDVVESEIRHQKLLKEALDTAERANAEKSNFLSRMSHDMRTPLNGIIGLLEIDKKHENDIGFLKSNREKAFISASHLLSLINDVLDMSKIEEGGLVLNHEPFDLIRYEKETQMLIDMQAQKNGIDFTVHIAPEIYEHPFVYGSPLHLRRAMMNIYSNCIKYNRENGAIHTEIHALPSHDHKLVCRWTISDTGIGINKEYLEKIFEPFTQENMDARSVYHGTGLGMSIAKALFEQMGGTIEISSTPGIGSTFVITLPFEEAEETDISSEPESERNSIQGIKILLAEDNEINREVAQVLLEEEGAVVTAVSNGREAVKLFSRHPEGTFDVILMDIMMPLMDGYEATRQIRKLDRMDASSIPIIALTANAFAEDVRHALDCGMNAHLAKPLDVKKMIHTIACYCSRVCISHCKK